MNDEAIAEAPDYGTHIQPGYYQAENEKAIVEQLKFLFDPEPVIKDIRQYLEGYTTDLQTGQMVPTGNPMMAEEGVSALIAEIRARLSQVIGTSWFDAEEVDEEMFDFSQGIEDMFAERWVDWGITLTQASRIQHHVCALVNATYNKAINGRSFNLIIRTSKFIQETKVANQNTNSDGTPRPGVLSRFFNRRFAGGGY